MKFTSIAFAAVVAATQFSSTFAATANNAVLDSERTYKDTAVTIDVSGNDSVQDSFSPSGVISIADAFGTWDILTYELTKGTTNAANGVVTINQGVTGVDSGTVGTPETFEYTPNAGFVGTDTFDYSFTITHNKGVGYGIVGTQSGEVAVTVIVSATPTRTPIKQTFEIPGLVSSGDAVKYNHVGLPNIVAVTPGTPDTDAFTAIVKPVFGSSADFAANTSNEAVNNMFAKSWASFIKFFRGGN
jgi:hypothetical protein